MNNKSKNDRFKKLAEKRTNDVLERLRILSNCSNRSAYDYTEEQVNKIFATIERATKDAKAKFHYPESKRGFKL